MQRSLLDRYASSFRLGAVGLSLPSEGERRKKVEAAVDFLRASGFSLKVYETVFSVHGYKTAPLEQRVAELNHVLRDPEIDVVLMNTGGYNTNETLEFVDYEALIRAPKWIVGYSDITALLVAIHAKTGLPTVNGCMLVDYWSHPECFSTLFATLQGEVTTLENTSGFWQQRGEAPGPDVSIVALEKRCRNASGRALAGNLSTLALLLGTPYCPSFKDRVVFLEYDAEEAHALPSLERYLWQLRHTGLFRDAAAVVFGTLEREVQSQETLGYGLPEILRHATAGFDLPVLFNAGFGHCYPSWSIINGQEVTIEGTSIAVHPVVLSR